MSKIHFRSADRDPDYQVTGGEMCRQSIVIESWQKPRQKGEHGTRCLKLRTVRGDALYRKLAKWTLQRRTLRKEDGESIIPATGIRRLSKNTSDGGDQQTIKFPN